MNVGASTSVSLIDVGLKLDIEPTIQLDDEVTIKLALEVSNLLRQVNGPNGSLAYQLGTRLTSTTLRLHDGQTQVLAGLINDEDRKSADGLPWPGASCRCWAACSACSSDTRNKTEIVMLITPRIAAQPGAAQPGARPRMNSGTDAATRRGHCLCAFEAAGAGWAWRPPAPARPVAAAGVAPSPATEAAAAAEAWCW